MENQQHGDEDDGGPVYQIDEVTLRDIGNELVELSRRLRDAGERLEGKTILDESGSVLYAKNAFEEMTHEEVLEENAEARSAFRATLVSLRQFRREYERWERLTAEFALTKMNYSQREAASALGVAASTINRWAQHPLKIEDYR
jgi:hypothetical protein